MTFVTRLDFQSGDRTVLEETVTDLKRMLERKGAECKGPTADPPEEFRVPMYRRLAPGDEFESWDYTVYTRRLEIHGSERVAGEVGHMDFPDSVHVEIEIDRKTPLGQGRDG